jgi:hypothetical protein
VVQLDHFGRDVKLDSDLFYLALAKHTHREKDILVLQPVNIGDEPD